MATLIQFTLLEIVRRRMDGYLAEFWTQEYACSQKVLSKSGLVGFLQNLWVVLPQFHVLSNVNKSCFSVSRFMISELILCWLSFSSWVRFLTIICHTTDDLPNAQTLTFSYSFIPFLNLSYKSCSHITSPPEVLHLQPFRNLQKIICFIREHSRLT